MYNVFMGIKMMMKIKYENLLETIYSYTRHTVQQEKKNEIQYIQITIKVGKRSQKPTVVLNKIF